MQSVSLLTVKSFCLILASVMANFSELQIRGLDTYKAITLIASMMHFALIICQSFRSLRTPFSHC